MFFTKRKHLLYYIVPCCLLLLIIFIEFYLILEKNHGVFIYTIDDPYIHLSISKHLLQGVYGYTNGELSSADSSILWPFLLTPWATSKIHAYLPLILNSIFTIFTLWIFAHILYIAQQKTAKARFDFSILLVLCLQIPSLNLVGLIFSGMEHSLQILLSVLLTYGLLVESQNQSLPKWLPMIIVLGPLVRYENLALSIPAIAYLFSRGYCKQALLSSFLLLLSLAGFSWFLYCIDQPWIPASIHYKSLFIQGLSNSESGFSWSDYFTIRFTFFFQDLPRISFCCFFAITILLALLYRHSINNQKLLLTWLSSVVLYFLCGNYGWLHRYELFIYAYTWAFIIYFAYKSNNNPASNFVVSSFLIPIIAMFSAAYLVMLFIIPAASHQIYLQPYQISLFAKNTLKEPIIVTDIGLNSYENPDFVQDLFGLGNSNIQRQIYTRSTTWMTDLAQQHNIKLAMIYKFLFFAIPQDWQLLGCLSLDHGRKTYILGSTIVHFYATKKEYVPFLNRQLTHFRSTLPKGVSFGHCVE